MFYVLLLFALTKSGWAQNMLGKGIRLQANENIGGGAPQLLQI